MPFLAELGSYALGSATQLIPFQQNISNAITYWSNSVWSNTLLDLDTLYSAYLYYQETTFDFETFAHQLGYDDEQIKLYKAAHKQIVDVNTAITLRMQGRIDDDTLMAILSQNDIDENTFNTLLKAQQWYPSPDRIIEWANHDIFNPQTVKRYTLDSGRPSVLNDMLTKAGTPEEMLDYLWYASWNYPSFYEGKYMYDWSRAHPVTDTKHNPNGLTFTLDDFKYLMRVSNYPEYFQELYTKILSNPLSYRQIAELYHYEIIKEEEMPRWLAWAGYNEEQIEVLQQLFKIMYAPEGHKRAKSYTISVVEQLYEHNKIDTKQFVDYVTKLGYTEEAANLYAEYIGLRKELELEREFIKEVEYNVKEHIYNTETAYELLVKNNVDRNYARYLTSYWDVKYAKRQHAIPEATLVKMVSSKIINMQQFEEQMRLHGYSTTQIQWFEKFYGLKK